MAASRVEIPRPLTLREREVLDFLVSVDHPAAEALRLQAATARVTEECECGCGRISLAVDREGTPRADLGGQDTQLFGGRLVLRKFRFQHVESNNDPEDPEETQWLTLFTEDGWIEGIENSWVSDSPPKGLPSPEGFSQPSIVR